jgi:membrane protease YdiL (CAAX protease family)
MKNAIVYTIVFAGIEILVGSLVLLAYQLLKGTGTELDAMGVIISSGLAGVVTIAVFLAAKWAVVSRHWIRTRPWTVLFWCVIATLGSLIPSSWLQELMPELPNTAEKAFDLVLKDRWGYFIVGLLAPLSEELVFRGAILRELLKWKENPWIGIVISAMLFSLVHMNPVQMPHAFLIGILLGWLYYRTDSIIPGVVWHWVNNTIAYVVYNLTNTDETLLEFFGSQQRVLMAVGFSLMIFLPALYQLNLRLSK